MDARELKEVLDSHREETLRSAPAPTAISVIRLITGGIAIMAAAAGVVAWVSQTSAQATERSAGVRAEIESVRSRHTADARVQAIESRAMSEAVKELRDDTKVINKNLTILGERLNARGMKRLNQE